MPDLGLEVLLKGKNAVRLLGGLWVALRVSLISVAISIPLGILLGVLMTKKNRLIRAILRIYLEIIRIMPQMVLLFLAYFGTARAFGWNLDGETAAIIVFALWGTAEMSDLVRGALVSIPRHQYESAEALGLTRGQVFRYVVLPQTVRRLLPQSINLITRMIKTTSLILMLGVVEVLKVAQQIIEANRPQCGLRHLFDGISAVFPGVLAHQPAGQKTGTKMEVTGDVRLIAGNKEPDQALR